MEQLEPEITQYEPRLALDGGQDGLDFVRKIRQDTPRFLKPDGWLVLENGPEIEVSEAGFTPAERKGCGGMGPSSRRSVSEGGWGSDPPE
jgi:methylase of polypeptide subunit release factors